MDAWRARRWKDGLTMAPRGKPADRSTIARAAIACFKRYGVHRTSMADVAQEAGLARQTVYRLFATRSELLEYIADQRILVMAEKLFPYFREVESLDEALIEGSLLSLRVGRSDKLFAEIVTQSGDHSFDQFLFRGSETVQKLMLDLWGPLLDRARAAGRLRAGLTNDYAVEWIRNVHSVLTMRDEDEAAQRRMLETFLVPSLVEGAAPAAGARPEASAAAAKAKSRGRAA